MASASSPPPTSASASVSVATNLPPRLKSEDIKRLGLFTDQPIVNVATCNLNQFALDFIGNQKRIIQSIQLAKAAGCTYRLGPELEITGYSCEDHFYELDTITFAWMSLRDIIEQGHTDDILCDFGMPILHNGVRYNCRVFVLDRKILLIRPKMWMADDGNYREDRHFTPWDKDKIEHIEEYQIPESMWSSLDYSKSARGLREAGIITSATAATSASATEYPVEHSEKNKIQKTAPFGVAILQCIDATIGAEICEELFTAESTNILLGFEGCDIMSNGSASHFEVGKLARRHELIKEATNKNGGIYMYSNMIGCDGNRMVFDGNGMIYMNGELKAIGQHLIFHEVEVVTAKLNLNNVRTFRAKSVSHQMQSDQRSSKLARIKVDFKLTQIKTLESSSIGESTLGNYEETETIKQNDIPTYRMEEEMGLAVSRWLFDYLTRSGSGSFLLPLSGGVDSSSTAMFVYFMCHILVNLLKKGNTNSSQKDFLHARLDVNVFRATPQYTMTISKWISEERRMEYKENTEIKYLADASELMNIILYTVNMPTRNNTSNIMLYALNLASALGSYHITADINDAFNGIKDIVKNLTFGLKFSNKTPTSGVISDNPDGPFHPLNPGNKFTKAGPESTPEETVQIPRTEPRDGVGNETLAIQNIQARLRMMCAFYLSQIIPSHRNVAEKMGTTGTNNLKAYQESKGRAETDQMRTEGAPIGARRENYSFVNNLTAAEKKVHDDIYSVNVRGAQMCLVLASSNSDEALRGFYTKYDAASADINPIGSFSKHDLRQFLYYCMGTKFVGENDTIPVQFNESTLDSIETKEKFNNNYKEYPFKVLYDILTVVASPELQEASPTGDIQDDEIAIKVTYEDLYEFGIMRQEKLGPLGMFYKMCRDRLGKTQFGIYEADFKKNIPAHKIEEAATPLTIFRVIDTLIKQYFLNRHKMTILTPALHATAYSPDDNRFDQRPFLYPNLGVLASYQLEIVKKLATEMESRPDIIAKIAEAKERGKRIKAAFLEKVQLAAAKAAAAASADSTLPTGTSGLPPEVTTELGGGARPHRNLTHLRRVTRDKKREAKRKSQTRKN